MARRRYYSGNVVWPLLLVLVGGWLLLNNLGVVERSLWSLALQLWPAVLLAIGVDILIPRRSAWGVLVAIIAVTAVFIGSIWLLNLVGQPLGETVPVLQPIGEMQSAEVRLEPAIGLLEVDGDAGPGLLVEGSADPIGSNDPAASFSQAGDRGRFQLTPIARPGVTVLIPTTRTTWGLSLTDSLPVDLRVDMGVGELELDLKGIRVENLEASFGVGRAEVDFPQERGLAARVEGGVGEILIRVPADSNVQIEYERGLTTLSLPAGYGRGEGSARSPVRPDGSQITLRIDLGVGTIRVVEW